LRQRRCLDDQRARQPRRLVAEDRATKAAVAGWVEVFDRAPHGALGRAVFGQQYKGPATCHELRRAWLLSAVVTVGKLDGAAVELRHLAPAQRGRKQVKRRIAHPAFASLRRISHAIT
jgi:hypothetical protein